MPTLYMLLLGCRPEGRLTEQHDVFFGVADSLPALVPQLSQFWPGVKLHLDAYRTVTQIGEYHVEIASESPSDDALKLFFINLGAYVPPEFEEFHQKLLIVAPDMATAIKQAKQQQFYRDGQQFSSALRSHVDDKMEVDDVIDVGALLPHHSLVITPSATALQDDLHIGYLPLAKVSVDA